MTPAESTQSKGVEYPVRWSLSHRSQRSMPALPRSILHLGAGLSVALAKRRLKGPDRSLVAQEKAYYHLVRRLANTQQGRDHAIKARMGYDQFRAGVPIRVYEDLLPQIESAKRETQTSSGRAARPSSRCRRVRRRVGPSTFP